MKIHCFQHVHFEDLGCIHDWIDMNSHTLNYTRFYENSKLPNIDNFDLLIIMGGPMSANDEEKFTWLKTEKNAIKEAIKKNKLVIGICLGSQLIANVLGEKVYKNSESEIGWFDISLIDQKESENIFIKKGNRLKVFHWHGETYKLPENSVRLASSECCENQAFLYNKKVLGLQFHLEVTKKSMVAMIENGRIGLNNGKYIQSENEMLKQAENIESNNKIMIQILDNITKNNGW